MATDRTKNGGDVHRLPANAAVDAVKEFTAMARTNPSVSTSVRSASGSSPPTLEVASGKSEVGTTDAATTCLHGRRRAKRTDRGPLVGALVQSTTFVQRHVGDDNGPSYSRVSNPTVDEVEEVLGALEDAPPSVCFGTGLAAETALFLSLLRAGDHAVVGDAIYGGTVRLFRQVLSELGITSTFVDSSDPAAVSRAITGRTKLVFIETPANPTLKLTDIAAIAQVCKRAGVPLAVDNTFLTPVLQRPLDLGADISVYSTTKHIEGHSTALGGAITSRDAKLLERIRWIRKCTGGIIAPFNAWLTVRGLKTLPLRLKEQSRNAQRVAEWLAAHPAVQQVHYPGLRDFPQAALAATQHVSIRGETLHGGVISFELAGGTQAGIDLLNNVKLCSLVEHVGSVETLITHPASMTHADVPPEHRRAVGIADGLVRLSVGLEDPTEVINDLEQAISQSTIQNPQSKIPSGSDIPHPTSHISHPTLNNGHALTAGRGGFSCAF
jgi:cystathionine beta-lyase/cystathionine gamma-synthase